MATQLFLRGAAALGFGELLGLGGLGEPTFFAEPIVLASPVGSFHNATLQVYAQVLRDMGHTVTTVTNIEHKLMYPHFTGAHGAKRYIDMVVSSDLPNNHKPWLGAYTDSFNVVGTCYELLQIYLAAPSYTGLKSLTDLKNNPAMNKTLIGFDIDPCARCPDLANEWIKDELGEGFTYVPYSEKDLKVELTRKLAAKEVFATTLWSPTYWDSEFPLLQRLNMGKFTKQLFNQGKALVSIASPLITNPAYARTLRAVSAVFVGTDEVSKMDYEIFKMGKEADNAAYTVAQQWIKDNHDTYQMFMWR